MAESRRARSLLDRLKSYLDIRSPSRAFADLKWSRVDLDEEREPPTPIPWYAARHPLDAHESPDVRAAARRVRRLIRRHWFELFFEPQSPIALSVCAAMQAPPDCSGDVCPYVELAEG